MHINIVSSLDAGSIASLLEVFAIFTGLLIAANVQAIVSLAARRRLFSRGTARLSDSTWNVGVLQGVTNPRRLLRDCRAFLAFFLALVVICLEVLTVLQTRSSQSCAFREASTWDIKESTENCFSTAKELTEGSDPRIFISRAKERANHVDLNLGIPINADIFERSILSGKAVQNLKDVKFTKVFTVPVLEVYDITGTVRIRRGAPTSSIKVVTGKVAYDELTCASGGDGLGGDREGNVWTVLNPEYGNFDRNGSVDLTAATGFLDVQPCKDDIVFRVCDYVGGRQDLPPVVEFSSQLGSSFPTFEIQCKFHVVSREGRLTDARVASAALDSTIRRDNPIDTSSIRRAVFASLIAQNSASGVPCRRYIAAPKECTQIGAVSISALSILTGLFILTSLIRLGLRMASRDVANFNGSPQRLAEALFSYFEGPERALGASVAPGKRKKSEFIMGPRLNEEDIYMSVMKGINEPDSYRLVWTRGPLPEGQAPASHIPSKDIVPHADKVEDEEVSLVY